MEFNKKYFVTASEEWGESVAEYYAKTPYNYVIIEGGDKDFVVKWNNDCPVIFGSIDDALDELRNWMGGIRNVSIITEKEFIDTYCKDELIATLFEK